MQLVWLRQRHSSTLSTKSYRMSAQCDYLFAWVLRSVGDGVKFCGTCDKSSAKHFFQFTKTITDRMYRTTVTAVFLCFLKIWFILFDRIMLTDYMFSMENLSGIHWHVCL